MPPVHRLYPRFAWALLAILILVMLLEIDWKLLPIAAVILGLLGLHFQAQLTLRLRQIITGVVLAAVISFTGLLGIRMVQNVVAPPGWDFACFWLYGRIGVQGLNYYDPASYQVMAQQAGLTADPEFKHEIVDIGFFYPPVTMWLMLPLGLTDIHTAMAGWYVVQIVVGAAIIALLWRAFLPQDASRSRWLTFGLAVMLFIAMQPTRNSIGMGQSMFLLMLCFILFWLERKGWRGGMWLALAVVVKPFMAILVLYLLLRRRWAALIGAVISGLVITIFTVVGLGLEQTVAYFVMNPTPRMPPGLYIEWTNQSLLSGILRLIGYSPAMGSGLTHPLFLASAAALVLVTVGLVLWRKRLSDELALALVTPLAVLLYPASQDMYTMILLLPLLMIWSQRQALRGGVWTAVAIIGGCYYLMVTQTVLASLVLWVFLVWMAAGQPVLPRFRLPRSQPAIVNA
jgi:hypothetical protein